MAQISNEELIKTACDMINAKRSAQRIRGAKLIRKHALAALGEQLYAAFLRELKDARTWEVKSEMLKALGVINFTAATSEIEKIVARNLPRRPSRTAPLARSRCLGDRIKTTRARS